MQNCASTRLSANFSFACCFGFACFFALAFLDASAKQQARNAKQAKTQLNLVRFLPIKKALFFASITRRGEEGLWTRQRLRPLGRSHQRVCCGPPAGWACPIPEPCRGSPRTLPGGGPGLPSARRSPGEPCHPGFPPPSR